MCVSDCDFMCVQIRGQVSETSSGGYLCLSLRAITSLPLLAETTGSGWSAASVLTDLSACRADAGRGNRERERAKFLRGLISQESCHLHALSGRTDHTLTRLTNSAGKQRKRHHHKWQFVSSWPDPCGRALFCINKQMTRQNVPNQ